MRILLLTYLILYTLPSFAKENFIVSSHFSLENYLKLGEKETLSFSFPGKDIESVRKACQMLQSSFQQGEGPFGIGLSNDISCFAGRKKIFGKRLKSAADWKIVFKGSKRGILKILMYAPNKKKVSSFRLNGGKEWIRLFEDPHFTDLVALKLFDQSPFLARLQKNNISKGELKYQGRLLRPSIFNISFNLKQEIQAPKKMIFYALGGEFPKGPFTSDVLAVSGNLAEGIDLKNGKIFTWLAKTNEKVENTKSEIFVHNLAGPGAFARSIGIQLKMYEKKIKSGTLFQVEKKKEDGFLSDALAAGYLGFRYGLQVRKEEPLLRNAVSYGFLGEFRSGFIKGLRVYYDLVPELKNTRDGFDTSLSSSRLVLGTALTFSLGLPNLRFDIVPKIGIWSFESVLPSIFEDDGSVAGTSAFSVHKKLSGGGEFGLETEFGFMLVRAWYGIDVAFSLFGLLGTQSVTSNRYGIDTQFALGNGFQAWEDSPNFKFGIKLYGYFEDVTLEDISKDPPAEGTTLIRAVNLAQTFVGLGLGLSW